MAAIPEIRIINGKKILFADEKPFYMLSGEIHNSSSSSMEFLEPIFDKLQGMHLNSVLLPVTWQMLEKEQGQFDYSLTDEIIASAEKHGLKLGLLWFGSWKNAQCSYAPEWVKRDTKTYFRAELQRGKPHITRKSSPVISLPYSTISPFCEAAMKADANAFAHLMAHIRDTDTNRTVITVQVENETGFLGGDMDYCDAALEKYAQDVPAELVEYLSDRYTKLDSRLTDCFSLYGKGSWEQVFSSGAHEAFIAYYTAKYVEYVAAAGKAEYPLPMSVNCWLDGEKGVPGKYPCGGPVAKVMEIWQCAAPSVDIFAPDIYLTDFMGICDSFTKNGNPAYVPESKPCSLIPGRELYIIGHHHGMCFSSFGVEDIGTETGPDLSIFAPIAGFAVSTKKTDPMKPELYGKINSLMSGAMPVLAPLMGTDRMDAYAREKHGLKKTFRFGDCALDITGLPFGPCKDSAALIARTEDDEFVIINYGCIWSFRSVSKDKPYIQHLSIEEGRFEDGRWVTVRVLNGDEEMLPGMGIAAYKIKINCFS